MRLGKTSSVEDIQTLGRFEDYKKILLSPPFAGHLDKLLAYWALPTDRRPPLAFLGRTLRDLLSTPLVELAATPSIGRNKMVSFVGLLARAAETDPAGLPANIPAQPNPSAACIVPDGGGEAPRFNPSNISESTWAWWRASVVRGGLAGETLGRLAPSLRNMTRVIWNTPLGVYTSSTLAEIRAMKTHGEKRLRAILDVFHAADALVAGMGEQGHLVVRIVPRRIDRVEHWTNRTLQRPGLPDPQDIFENFIQPLLEQVRTDAPTQVVALAEYRLGVAGPMISVRQAARTMRLTRARVYQLLNEINDILMVRWPIGRHQTHELREKFLAETDRSPDETDLRQFHAAVELFYPGGRRGAAGPLEEAFDPIEQQEELLEVS
ncbi:MAG: hypothetical protein K8R46_12365 [Pirellulales bacterium]|nr:hypothetical protein [Pirellulales bacterium]